MKSIFAVSMSVMLAATARAVNSMEQEFNCPLDGNVWKQRVESSSSPRGLRLDLRQLGDVVDPPTLPQCPKCRFPLFSERLSAAALERLRPFVRGADFQMFAAKNPSYFSLAQVQEFLRAPHRYIALSYLRASWQVEDREAISLRFLEKALNHFVLAIDEMQPDDPKFSDMTLLRGEVERRLGKWDDAEKHFRELQAGSGLKDPKLKPIVAMQLDLIEQRDSGPKAMSGGARPSVPAGPKAESAPTGTAAKTEEEKDELELPLQVPNPDRDLPPAQP